MAIPGGILLHVFLARPPSLRRSHLKICRQRNAAKKLYRSGGERCDDRAKIAAGVATVVMAFVAIIALTTALLVELAAGLVLPMPLWKYFWLCAGTAGVDHGCGLE